MTSQSKLSVRPLPHLDFVLGWPGIGANSQASRSAAHISGNIEVRLGSKGLKSKWLRIELRKKESVTGGENWGELIGQGPIDVWNALPGKGAGDRSKDGGGGLWEVLQTADFPFRISIPEGLPPTCKLDKQCGISYEIVASLCVKTPKGLFKKDESTTIIQAIHPIIMEKHELHSTWPVYNQPDMYTGEKDLLRAKMRREKHCFAPGDRVKVKVIVASERVEPAKIKSVALSIKQTVTFHGVKGGRMTLSSNTPGGDRSASQHVETITQKAKQVGKKLYKGDSADYDLECTIPKHHDLMSISTAKHIEVSFTMRVYVDIAKAPIIIDHVPMFITTFSRAQSVETMRKIGFVEGLSERELLIEDEDMISPIERGMSTSSRRPTHPRSASYGGSSYSGGASTGRYDNMSQLQRRDTMMTQYSGPGFAGRGVPGQIFSYGSYGAVQSYDDGSAEAPRSAFAGPASVYEAEGALSATERAALNHYHTSTSHALAMGVDYTTIAAASGLEAPPPMPESQYDTPAETEMAAEIRRDTQRNTQRNMQANRANRMSMPAGGMRSPSMQQQQRRDEEERERLYQRAQQQGSTSTHGQGGERRPQAYNQSSSSALPNSRQGTPNLHETRRDGRQTSPQKTLAQIEEEKAKLYERARREAETYQRGYAQGATFPSEDENSSSGHSRQPQRDVQSSAPKNRASLAVDTQARRPADRRDSDTFWLDSAAGRDAGEGQSRNSPAPKPAPIRTSGSAIPFSSATSSAPAPRVTFMSAEDEKKRLYDQAKAQTENHLKSQQAAASSSSRPRSAIASSPAPPSTASPPPLSEKAQLARFQAAQDAVQRYQNGESSVGQSQGSQSALQSNTVPGPSIISSSSASASTAAPPTIKTTPAPGPLSEKEQMRLYYEAKDRQAEAENPSSSSLSAAALQRHSTGSTLASPKATYAPNYNNNNNNSWQNRTSPLPQGQFSHSPQAAPLSTNLAKPASPFASSSNARNNASPVLPTLDELALGNGKAPRRNGTPSTANPSYAPRFASSSWAEDVMGSSSFARAEAPPPLPPKTPIAGMKP